MANDIRYYLAIDWGMKKIGLAIADEETKIASPLKTVETKKFWDFFEQLLEEFNFTKIIVGAYLIGDKFHRNNSQIRDFVSRLENSANIKIERTYEGFSSKIARQNIKESGGIVRQDDAESARIILQGWLDEKR